VTLKIISVDEIFESNIVDVAFSYYDVIISECGILILVTKMKGYL